ncbi:trwN protein [Bartonella machadoae]|uniref:trwN protein n=1 Tax=Bartonella machadoae TaxID=2893471 RepID=UPI001F4D0F50|nr:trwN protein [Bartonella machadoae]UNE54077.1 trwN protein [Bartonella machadoae]
MTLPDFMTFAAVCASAVHPATFSTVAMQESKDDICAINVRDHFKLSHQLFTLKEAIKTTEYFGQNEHNFDVNWRQFSVQSLIFQAISNFDVFYPYKNLKVVQTALTHCYEQTTSKYSSEQTELQAVLNFYNSRNFKSGFTNAYVQKIAFHVEGETHALMSGDLQKSVKLHATKQEPQISVDSLPPPSEELADVFTHKVGSIRDAFTEEDLPSSEKQ